MATTSSTPVRQRPLPWLVAHRGARDEAPENTAAAFERALSYPIDGIELDVQMGVDQTLVIYHDWTTYRLNRKRTRLSDLTRAQMAALDWGAWHDPARAGTPMLTLDETLRQFSPRTRLLVEIKSSEQNRRSGHSDRLTRQVVNALEKSAGFVSQERLYILSFDPEVLNMAHRLAPQWRYVWIVPEYSPGRKLKRVGKSATAHLSAICVRIAALDESLMHWAGDRGLRCFTYTCNGPRQVQKAMRLGVDAILTDRPGWLTNWLGK